MPAARAAAGLAPTATKRRPGTVVLISTLTRITAIAATIAVFGIPSVLCPAKVARAGVALAVACPLVSW